MYIVILYLGIDIIHLDRDWKRARRPIDITLCWAGTIIDYIAPVSWPMLKELTVLLTFTAGLASIRWFL